MGKIEELKDYLRCVGNSIYDSDEVEKKFEIIAEILKRKAQRHYRISKNRHGRR